MWQEDAFDAMNIHESHGAAVEGCLHCVLKIFGLGRESEKMLRLRRLCWWRRGIVLLFIILYLSLYLLLGVAVAVEVRRPPTSHAPLA
jgi:hypothetical protein